MLRMIARLLCSKPGSIFLSIGGDAINLIAMKDIPSTPRRCVALPEGTGRGCPLIRAAAFPRGSRSQRHVILIMTFRSVVSVRRLDAFPEIVPDFAGIRTPL